MKQKTLLHFWLLLFALIVGSGNAWATDVKYTISSTSSVSTTGTAPTGSSVTFSQTYNTACQMTANNSQTLTLKNYYGYKITGLKLSMHSNKSSGGGKLSYSTDGGSNYTYIVGSSSSGSSFNTSNWYGGWSQSYVDVTKSVDITATTSDLIIKIEATANSIFCQSYTITYEAVSSTFSVTYDDNDATSGSVPEDDNEYEDGDEVTVLGNTGSLTKTGYTFGGWNTKADGTGTNYDADDTFEITSDITLYAKWVAKTAAGLAYATPSYTVLPGASFDTPTLSNDNDLTVSYSSNNTSVASVNSSTGAVTIGTTEGTATITASSEEDETYAAGSASYTITVAKGTTTVTLNHDELSFNIIDGTTQTLTGTPKYNSAAIDGAAVTWSVVSGSDYASVSDAGVVTALAPGSATIRASYAGTTIYASSYAECAVTVNKANTTLTLDEDEVEQDLKDGRTITLTPTVKAAKSDDSEVTLASPTVTWESSDETIATVSGGVVTGLKAGEVTITASYAGAANYNAAEDATCDITFTDTRTGVSISTFTAAKTTLVIGDEQATTVTNDQGGWTPAYTYTSSNEDVATVDEDGVITAVAKGTATITATINISLSETGYKAGATTSKTLDITVTKPFHTVTFSVNGNTDRTASIEEDQAITFPTAVETTPGDGEFPKVVNDQTFQGWYTEPYTNASVAPTYVNTASATMSTSDVTYYAVYADVEEEESDDVSKAVKDQTLSYDTWSYSGSTTDKTSYRLFHTNSYIESASFDLSKLIKVVVKGGTFGGSDYNSLTIGDGTNTWKSVTVSGKSETGTNTYTDGTALSGTNKLRITCNSGTASSTGVRISSVEIYVKGTVTTKSNYTTDNRSAAGISYANAEMDVKLSSGSTGQALTNPNSLSGITYSSSDATVATVNSSTGAITALLKVGETTITATFAGNATYKPAEVSYTLNVTEKTPAGLAYATDEVEKLTTDAAFTNTLTNGYSLTVSYSSDDEDVATVNSSTGEVTIKGAGSTTITASFAGDEDYEAGNASYTLTVNKAAPTLSFASDNATLRQGEDFAGNALTNPASLTISYSSSNTSVATVNASTGVPSFVAAGSTTITASFAGNDTYTSGSASYTLKVLATPTISVSDDEVAYGETYTVDDSDFAAGAVTVTSGNTNIATVEGLEITPVACGEVEITVRTAENDTYKAGEVTFTLTVTAPAGKITAPSSEIVAFEETFNKCNGTGANDDTWSGSIAAADIAYDNDGWTASSEKGAYNCAKFGTSSAGGSATTPNINLEEDIVYTLTFKAGAWDGKSEGTSLSVSATNATIKNEANTATVSSVTTSKGAWTSYTLKVIVTDASDPVKITFSTSGGNKRFFLDEVKVFYEKDPTATVKLNKYGYATYCSVNPIDFTSTTGYTAWRVSNIEDDVITFTKITGKIKGGQGVLLYNKNADGENTTNVTIKFADGTTEFTSEENLLFGTTAPTYVAADTYFGLSGNQFVKVNAGTVPAGKALLPASAVPDEARELTFVFEDSETTGVNDVRSKLSEVREGIYDMQGRKVAQPTKGLYIVNGKKVVIK